MSRRYPVYPILLAVITGWIPPSQANDTASAVMAASMDAGFSELERRIIGQYYLDHSPEPEQSTTTSSPKEKGKRGKSAPAGLAKRDHLPPGLARLQKSGKLPPGLAKRELPGDLEQQLPPPPAGYERQVVEDAAIVLVHTATGVVADIINDAIMRH